MNLKELIKELSTRNPDNPVINGFGEGMSWRGSYGEAAFEPVESTNFGDMLKHAKNLLNSTQTGYKGGDFVMHEYVDTHIAEYGETGEPINSFNFKFWDGCEQ